MKKKSIKIIPEYHETFSESKYHITISNDVGTVEVIQYFQILQDKWLPPTVYKNIKDNVMARLLLLATMTLLDRAETIMNHIEAEMQQAESNDCKYVPKTHMVNPVVGGHSILVTQHRQINKVNPDLLVDKEGDQ